VLVLIAPRCFPVQGSNYIQVFFAFILIGGTRPLVADDAACFGFS